jgi:tetratricopeptide (TPR) repeat protein
MAALRKAQGKYQEAEQLAKQALDIYVKTLGQEHPDVSALENSTSPSYHINNSISGQLLTFGFYAGLATIHFEQGRYDTAEQELQRSLAISEKGTD